MSTEPEPPIPNCYEIWIAGTVEAEFLRHSAHLESRQSSATTVLRIETDDGPAEIVAGLLALGRKVVSIRLVA